MIIKPYNNDLWFRIPQRKESPDDQDRYFAVKGEFSPYQDIAFDKHINKLVNLNNSPYIQKLNGKRIKTIREFEGFWY